MRFAPFDAAHLEQIELSPAERAQYADSLGDPQNVKALIAPGLAFTGFLTDGRAAGAGSVPRRSLEVDGAAERAVGAAGIIRLGHRGHCWMLLGSVPSGSWTPIVRKIAGVFGAAQEHGIRRLEATVDADFWPGMKLMRFLGFEVEGRLRGYAPDGRDHIGYARVR